MFLEEEIKFPSKKQQDLENVLIILTIFMIIIGITFIYFGLKSMILPFKGEEEADPVKIEVLEKIQDIENKIDEIKGILGDEG